MYKAQILIIGERKELLVKYKKLIENLNQDVIISNNLSDALLIMQKEVIEFIIISDTIKEKLSEFIRKIRVLTFNLRPIIIAVSKSNDLEDKLEILKAGADDFIGEEISKQEFQMRFQAHLRRYLESSINPITRLSQRELTIKAIKKSFKFENVSYLLLKIKNIIPYRKTHGEIAYEKVLQTLSAIINSTLGDNDYIGHIQENEFVLITNSMQCEKIASFLVFAFDNILNKFYSTDEFKNDYSIQSSDETKETKTGLMRLLISAVEKTDNDYIDILNNLNELNELCKDSKVSTYLIDRVKLKGETTITKTPNKVLIAEPDEALSYLLKNVCELNSIEVKLINSLREFDETYSTYRPDVVVLDWSISNNKESLKVAKKISKDNIKLIFSSSHLNKKEILKAGADLYIPKPYEIDDIIYWIKKFLNK